MKKVFLMILICMVCSGCVATAPVSIAWHSNSTVQHATHRGKVDKAEENNSVDDVRRVETDHKSKSAEESSVKDSSETD